MWPHRSVQPHICNESHFLSNFDHPKKRKAPTLRVSVSDEARLTSDIIELARQYGRYGYRQVGTRAAGQVNVKRVERIWRRHYNTQLPHSASGYRSMGPETIIPVDRAPTMH